MAAIINNPILGCLSQIWQLKNDIYTIQLETASFNFQTTQNVSKLPEIGCIANVMD